MAKMPKAAVSQDAMEQTLVAQVDRRMEELAEIDGEMASLTERLQELEVKRARILQLVEIAKGSLPGLDEVLFDRAAGDDGHPLVLAIPDVMRADPGLTWWSRQRLLQGANVALKASYNDKDLAIALRRLEAEGMLVSMEEAKPTVAGAPAKVITRYSLASPAVAAKSA